MQNAKSARVDLQVGGPGAHTGGMCSLAEQGVQPLINKAMT